MNPIFRKACGAFCLIFGTIYAYKIPWMTVSSLLIVLLLIGGLVAMFPAWDKKKT